MPGEPIALAAITASELLVGVERADTLERRGRRELLVEAILREVPVLPFDIAVARIHAPLVVRLVTSGRKIGESDVLIAATALAHGYEVLTDNLRDFERVPGLVVRRPSW